MSGCRISTLVGTLLVLLLSFPAAASATSAVREGPAVAEVVSDNPCC